MDSLIEQQPHLKAFRMALKSLPAELNDTYRDAMDRIGSQNKEDVKLAHRVLAWVTYANRPLNMRELQHALSIETGQTVFDEEALVDEDILIQVCLGLITVETNGTLRLIHYTAQNYFELVELEFAPHPHQIIASTCLTYLSLNTCQNFDIRTSPSALVHELQLLEYAGKNWGLHAVGEEQELEGQIMRFLSPRPSSLSSRLMIGGIESLGKETLTTIGLTQLCSRLEYPGIVWLLISVCSTF